MIAAEKWILSIEKIENTELGNTCHLERAMHYQYQIVNYKDEHEFT
jgi:hypothetical protein